MYKSGQGYWTRVMTGIAAAVLILVGASWIWQILMGVKVGDLQPIYLAAIGAGLFTAVLGAIAYYYIAVKRESVDFFVAVESEMKKVNWSTRREIIGSTWVVLFVTGAITLFVYVFDYAFFFFFVWLRVLDANA